jgi:hypothetical protein
MNNSSKSVSRSRYKVRLLYAACCGWPLPESHSGFLLLFASNQRETRAGSAG